MLSIFVCDDDPYYLKLISECVLKYVAFEEIDAELAICTPDPEKIIDYISKNKATGLYFMDVELEGGYNGVDVSKKIRSHDPRGFISFVTAHPNYMALTFEYKVEALAYIQKGADRNVIKSIKECIKDAYNKHVARADGGYIFKTLSGQKVHCNFEDIIFIETDKRGTKRVIIHTKKRQYPFYSTIDDVEKSLPNGLFYRCHKSYIVNVSNLTETNKKDILNDATHTNMSDGTTCQISLRRRAGLIKQF